MDDKLKIAGVVALAGAAVGAGLALGLGLRAFASLAIAGVTAGLAIGAASALPRREEEPRIVNGRLVPLS